MKSTFKFVYLLFFINITFSTSAQKPKGPESIAYDAKTKTYYLSSIYDNLIYEVKNDTITNKIVTTSPSLGIGIYNNILYAAHNYKSEDDQIKGYDLTTKKEVFFLTIPKSLQLNDIEFDQKGNLFVTDRKDDKVYQVDLHNKTYTILTSEIKTPNGLYFDQKQNRLLICNTVEKSTIYSYDLSKKILSSLYTTELPHLDGITMDTKRNIYVSSWSLDWKESAIFKFIPNNNTPIIFLKNNKGMADITFSKTLKSILIANIYDNLFIKEPLNTK